VIVVDTNVIAYLYLPCEFTHAAEALLEAEPEWAAPALWRSELRSVLAGYLQRGSLTFEQAAAIQAEAEDLLRGSEYDVDSLGVLKLAADSACSAYDCEFASLALALGVPLVTRDAALLSSFPETARPL
jgi:predicted nucleic acid-binding protein